MMQNTLSWPLDYSHLSKTHNNTIEYFNWNLINDSVLIVMNSGVIALPLSLKIQQGVWSNYIVGPYLSITPCYADTCKI